jgi:hypothetical protein
MIINIYTYNLTTNMVYKMTKAKVAELFEDCEMIEYIVVEMPTKDLMIHIESVEGAKISVLASNWDELMSVF